MIPFLNNNAGINLEDAAKFFDISEEQLISDLNLIWMCGLPGYTHLELIDVSYDSGFISIQNAQMLAKPMRITYDEGLALLLAIENLTSIMPESDSHILRSLQKKISDAVSLVINHTEVEESSNDNSVSPKTVLPEIVRALEEPKTPLEIEYYSATLDDYIYDHVSPIEITSMNGFAYLRAFSRNHQRQKYFRVNRIRKVIRQAGSPTGQLEGATSETEPASIGAKVTIDIDESAYWFIQKWALRSLVFDPQTRKFHGEIEVFDAQWLERAAMSAGGALEVLEPGSLRAQVASAAKRALQNYSDPVK